MCWQDDADVSEKTQISHEHHLLNELLEYQYSSHQKNLRAPEDFVLLKEFVM